MSFRPFTSESYAQDDRPDAWRDVLGAVGLQPASGNALYDGHATASHRNAVGVALTRMSAGSQGIGPLSPSADGLPIALLPIEDGVVLRQGASHRIVPVGHLLLLPRSGDWSVVFQRDMRAIVLSVTSEALHGRIAGKSKFAEARVVAPGGLADVFSRMLDATARTLEALDDVEWAAVAQSLVDLLLTFAHRLAGRRRIPATPQRRPRSCTGFVRPSSASSTILSWRRHASRRRKESPSDICKNCSRASATISPIMCASAGCSAPGPICPIHPRRIARSPKLPIATALAIPRISAAPSAIASDCRHANSASRRPNVRCHPRPRPATRLAAGRAGAAPRPSAVGDCQEGFGAGGAGDRAARGDVRSNPPPHRGGCAAGTLGLFQPHLGRRRPKSVPAIPSPSKR